MYIWICFGIFCSVKLLIFFFYLHPDYTALIKKNLQLVLIGSWPFFLSFPKIFLAVYAFHMNFQMPCLAMEKGCWHFYWKSNVSYKLWRWCIYDVKFSIPKISNAYVFVQVFFFSLKSVLEFSSYMSYYGFFPYMF